VAKDDAPGVCFVDDSPDMRGVWRVYIEPVVSDPPTVPTHRQHKPVLLVFRLCVAFWAFGGKGTCLSLAHPPIYDFGILVSLVGKVETYT